MNESNRMSCLIIDAHAKCKDNGHRMDWQRKLSYLAAASCLDCGMNVKILIGEIVGEYTFGYALKSKCRGKKTWNILNKTKHPRIKGCYF